MYILGRIALFFVEVVFVVVAADAAVVFVVINFDDYL